MLPELLLLLIGIPVVLIGGFAILINEWHEYFMDWVEDKWKAWRSK